jgi:hypothetical protein
LNWRSRSDSRASRYHRRPEPGGALYGQALDGYARCLYYSPHTTAGYLPQSLAARLQARPSGLGPYLNLFRAVFPEGAGYLHDSLDLRDDLEPAQREVEPINADSHLAYRAPGCTPACPTPRGVQGRSS